MAWLGLEHGTLRRDLALAGASLVGGLLLLAVGFVHTIQDGPDTPTAAFLAPLVAGSVALALRRRATRTSLAVGTVAIATDLALLGRPQPPSWPRISTSLSHDQGVPQVVITTSGTP